MKGFTQRLVDSAPPVEMTIAAGREVQWILQGMEVVTAPDTRVEVVGLTIRFYPNHE